MMRSCLALLSRDVRLVLSRGAEGATGLCFFAAVATLFPFALGAEEGVLKHAAAGILWIAVALASLLSLDNIWHRDHDDGTFDLLLLSPVPPLVIVFAKIAAHWLASGLLLTVASIIVSQMLFVPPKSLPVLIVSLLLGTLYISLLGGLGAVLTFGARRPGLLLALLILPLFIPMLILGAAVGEAVLAGLPCSAYLLLQASLTLGALALVPPAAAAFLKLHMRSS